MPMVQTFLFSISSKYIISDGTSITGLLFHAVNLPSLLFLYQVYPPKPSVTTVPNFSFAIILDHTVGNFSSLFTLIKYSLPS